MSLGLFGDVHLQTACLEKKKMFAYHLILTLTKTDIPSLCLFSMCVHKVYLRIWLCLSIVSPIPIDLYSLFGFFPEANNTDWLLGVWFF